MRNLARILDRAKIVVPSVQLDSRILCICTKLLETDWDSILHDNLDALKAELENVDLQPVWSLEEAFVVELIGCFLCVIEAYQGNVESAAESFAIQFNVIDAECNYLSCDGGTYALRIDEEIRRQRIELK